MKGLVFHGVGDVRYEDVPRPSIEDGEVLIRVRASGICGSDIHGYTGKTDRRCPPMIMGHEFAGDVIETSDEVFRVNPGDRVVVQPILFCGTCDMCKAGMTNICRNKSLLGVLGKNGAMAEYVAVPEQQVLLIPETMSYETASLLEPLAVAYAAAIKATFSEKHANSVLVIGCGTIGLCIVSVIKAMADVEMIALDVQGYRLDVARRLGADHCLDSSSEDIQKHLEQLIPQGADIAFEAVGLDATVKLAMDNLGVNGLCVWVGNCATRVDVNMQDVVVKMKTIRGSYAYTHDDLCSALDLMVKETPDLSPLISKVVPLSEGAEMFSRLSEGKEGLIKVVLST